MVVASHAGIVIESHHPCPGMGLGRLVESCLVHQNVPVFFRIDERSRSPGVKTMLLKRVWLLKWFTCLTAGIVVCWLGYCEAYDPWKGQVIVRVNVRQAPGGTSPVITQIDQGVEVTIRDEKEGWYKVIVEEDTFGFIGWVYAKYVRHPTDPTPMAYPPPDVREKAGILSSKATTEAIAHEAPIAIDRRPNDRPGKSGKSDEVLEKGTPSEDKAASVVRQKEIPSAPQAEMVGGRFQHAPQNKSVGKKEADQPEIGKATGEERAHAIEVPLQKTPQEGEKRHASIQDPSSSTVAMSHTAPLENEAFPSVKKLNIPSPKSDPVVAISQEKAPAETKGPTGHGSEPDPGWRVVMGVVVKLVVVAFSCLALIFAYRAWQITNERNKE
jgi:hypothetical protein